jgi:bifunctional NMN adenylyltransferase/nudix hydrolase
MINKKYDTLVFILRGQPFHNAHLEIIKYAAKLTRELVIIVGSSNQPRTFKNPFSFDDRKQMIDSAIRNMDLSINYNIESLTDNMYNDQAWAAEVQNIVSQYGPKVGIIGHKKDESSFYLDMFPQWEFESVPLFEPLDATSIRNLYFVDNVNFNFIQGVVPQSVLNFLRDFSKTKEYQQIISERKFIENYKQQFANLPYPPIFVTVDSVVIQSGHVLMIKRRSEPGKGLWALPGGFLNANTDRSVEDAMIRELREETGIKIPVPVLKGSVKGNRVFDAIGRSARGRTITHAFKIVLPDGELPKVRGQDDAVKAKWVPISAIKSEDCFEDHWEIVQHFVGS